MHAMFVVVDGADADSGPSLVTENVVPRVKQAGARSGVWLYRGDGLGTSVVTFDDEQTARRAADMLSVGSPVMPGVEGSPVVRSVEVCQVVLSF